jgi:glycerophosphoryl diester phosphodiesterase
MLYLDRLYRPPAQALEVPQYHEGRRIVTPRFIQAAHGRHMAVHVWTVNDINDMEPLIDLGVDGIDTDYPDRLLTLLERRQ